MTNGSNNLNNFNPGSDIPWHSFMFTVICWYKNIKAVISMSPYPMSLFFYTVRPGDTLWQIAQRYNTSVQSIAAVNPGVDLNFLHVGQVIRIIPGCGFYPLGPHLAPGGISKAESELRDQVRLLWEQHVVWTRLFILSAAFNLPDLDPVTDRLLQNPKDFQAALRPLYGNRIASSFAELLTNHLVIAAELVKAAKAGNNKAAEDTEKRWYANANEIAAFLAGINPYWFERNWRSMLHEHLALTKNEAVYILTGKYREGIAAFDQIEKQALQMADVMVQGIVNQFPEKFRSRF